jgi:ABC-2 type transport system ATP-binding protein
MQIDSHEPENDRQENDMTTIAIAPPAPSADPRVRDESSVLRVQALVKRYGKRVAVGGIDLDVRRGEIFAFLGPNGAGKTTTVEILEGFRERSSGDVSVLAVDPAHADGAWRDRVGVVLQESQPEPGLTVRECLALYAGYYSAPRDIGEVIELVGLGDKADALAEQLSGGQQRRLDFALALIGDPELIFLDEPTTGFDPSARRVAWEVIEGLRSLGKTIFLTTHYMDEAERLADRIAVIADGRIVAHGTPETLGGRDRMQTLIAFTLPAGVRVQDLPGALAALVAQAPGHGHPQPEDTDVEAPREARITLRSDMPLVHLRALADWALDRGVQLADLHVSRPTLEDVYLSLTTTQGSTR